MMKKFKNTIAIFEDNLVENFLPLTYFRPVYNLRTGILSLKDKIFAQYKNVNHAIVCRNYLVDYMKYRFPNILVNDVETENVLFINGRVLANKKLSKLISINGGEEVFVLDKQIIAIRAKNKRAKELSKKLNGNIPIKLISDLKQTEIKIPIINYLWDLVKLNGSEISNDVKLLPKLKVESKNIHKSVSLINKKNISIGKNSIINPFVVIDASNGPVVIGENVTVNSHVVIIGPVFIGNDSIIKSHASIYQNTSIGTMCKIGGEIEGTIFHGFSNKQHDGFLGHSYIGAWVNLGANTINSDLKNNYSNVKVNFGNKIYDTNLQFVGAFIGDHTKTAINTSINTGTIIGVSSNIFGLNRVPKFVPSFSWGTEGEKYNLDKSLEVAKKVMVRRHKDLSETGIKLFKKIFDLSKKEK